MQIQEILTTAFHVISIGYSLVLSYKFAMGLRALRPVPVTARTVASPAIQSAMPANVGVAMPQGGDYAIAPPNTAIAEIEDSPNTAKSAMEIAPIPATEQSVELADPWNEPEPKARKNPRWTWMGSIQNFESFPLISAPPEGKSTILRLKALPSSTTVHKPLSKKVELENLPSRQLKKMASEAKIPNYSKMRKTELIAALSA